MRLNASYTPCTNSCDMSQASIRPWLDSINRVS